MGRAITPTSASAPTSAAPAKVSCLIDVGAGLRDDGSLPRNPRKPLAVGQLRGRRTVLNTVEPQSQLQRYLRPGDP